ncbi:HNH endonuclease signature motif containing protein [Planococcus sp. N028]|uniref:HNH endonuclease signature motif containing protein n=1 Tax=Planococcus shixiaomingii TaxID=3058393 RepID=A0ABT8N533_9BACL|nr:HNH endonuclease signature motif containing protein [Planococcus sp. N028]MDN7242858.1 HNH endonuclease signature motif containing protein [Planococcus sp. N028]
MALKDQPNVRYALWQAYQRRCAICYEDLFNYSDLEIDHIIAESNENDNLKLNDLLNKYELPLNFDLNSLENLRPAHRKCNNKKRDSEAPEEITAQLLRIARNKLRDVKTHIKRFEEEAKYALNVEAVRTHLKNGDINIEQYVDQINNYVSDYGVEEFKTSTGFSSHVLYKNKTVMLEGYLPKIRDPKGSCLLTFNSFYIRGTTISLDHKEILKNLYPGNQSPIEFRMRSYIIDKITDDSFIVQLGNSRFTLNIDELNNLCLIIDKFIKEYITALEYIENLLQANEFIPHEYDLTKYKLLKVRRDLWDSILTFSRKNDYEQGNDEWNIFDATGNNIIKVYLKEKTKLFNEGYKCFIHSFIEDSYSWKPSDYVWLVWWDINHADEYKLREYWNVQQTYDWLTKELLPYVIYNQINPTKKALSKRKISYDEFKKSINVAENYFNGEKRYYRIEQIEDIDKLVDLVIELNTFYSVIKDVFLQREDVIGLYHAILLSLKESDHIDYHYICSKLGIAKTSNKEKIVEAIRNEIENLSSDDTLKMSGYKLDIIFRILYSNINSMSHTLQYDEIKIYLKYIEPFIKDFNRFKIAEIYSK